MSLNKENFPNFKVKHTSTSDFINRENFNLPAIDELSSEIEPLKNELYQLATNYIVESEVGREILSKFSNDVYIQKLITLIALSTTSYNQVYLLSRKESIKLQYELDSIRQQNSQLYLKIGLASSEINQQNLTIPALNEAYFLFLQNTPSKYDWIVEDKDSVVPVKAFGVTSNKQIYFNSADFYLKPEKASYSEYDFHDFIHYIVGSANTQFASKYYPSYDNNGQIVEAGLINLPKNLRSLITSSPKKENLKSDGYILSNKTFSWFYEKFEDLGSPIHILPEQQKQIVEYISEKLKEYLQELNVSLLELAVLMQNKLYEASASECESLGFVRGGAGDPLKGKTERGRADLDILFNLNPLQKIAEVAKIAQNPHFRFHHEHRNTLRNRAQVLGYRKFAKQIEQKITESFRENPDSSLVPLFHLCQKIDQIGKTPEPINLFHEVYKIINQKK